MAVLRKDFGGIPLLTAEGISAPHGFTTRQGGVSQGYLSSLNLGTHRGDKQENVEENYNRLGKALGFLPQKAVLTHQTHTDIVLQVDSRHWGAGLYAPALPECDALVTNTPGTALVVFTADCTPILLYDPVTGAVGAAHAGWRGTAMKIGEKTVQAMVAAYGCKPEHIRAAIGPNIGQCCFQTDADVPNAIREAYGNAAEEYIRQGNDKFYVNLKAINALSLQQAGVKEIEIATECTACRPDIFWSHRIVGNSRGSQGGVIVCKEG